VLACTGVIQAYIEVRTLNALTHTTYGELVLLKTGLLGLLIGLGAVNRERVIPALRRLAAAAATPGEPGALLRRTMRGELAAMISVFGVTAALVAFTPPIVTAQASRTRVRQAPTPSHTSAHAAITTSATVAPGMIPFASGAARACRARARRAHQPRVGAGAHPRGGVPTGRRRAPAHYRWC